MSAVSAADHVAQYSLGLIAEMQSSLVHVRAKLRIPSSSGPMKLPQSWRANSLAAPNASLRSPDLRRTVVTAAGASFPSMAAAFAAFPSAQLTLNTRVGSPILPTSANILLAQGQLCDFLRGVATPGMLAAINKRTG